MPFGRQLIHALAVTCLPLAATGWARQLPSHNLLPVPAEMEWRTGAVRLDERTRVAVDGPGDPRLSAAVRRFIERLQRRTGFDLTRPLEAPRPATIRLTVASRDTGVPGVGDDESYSLDAGAGRIDLRAANTTGAIRGLETLLQLVDGRTDGFVVPAVSILDRPRFAWRGLLIDVGRHFLPVEVIKRNLDGMAAVKLNVLHWHLTEDQGFRVESRVFPKLHQLGSDGLYYTQEELREVVAYAADRGIRVVPEFDMPGHVTSWLVGYPELASAPGPYQIARTWGVKDPTFDPTREETYAFIERFVDEMAPIFPDAYWHIGGDENNGRQWAANPAIQAFMRDRGLADANALQTYFTQRLLPILARHGKRMMGWDEILQPGLPPEAVVHSWRGRQALFDAARRGYDGVLSNGYYIDLMRSAATHYAVDPLPEDSGLTPVEAARVLGGEATMWGEWVGPETVDSRIWPRTAAIAERLWSPRHVTDVDDLYRRLDVVSVALEDLGLTHRRNVPVLLRRLAGGTDTHPLEVLVEAVEPVEGYQRGRHQPWMTSQGPLTHLVDAASADSVTARRVVRAIGALLADDLRSAGARDELARQFAVWRDVQPTFSRLAARAPATRELVPLADGLSAMGRIGLDALAALASGEAPGAAWRDAHLAALESAATPTAALEFPFVAALADLITAAADRR